MTQRNYSNKYSVRTSNLWKELDPQIHKADDLITSVLTGLFQGTIY